MIQNISSSVLLCLQDVRGQLKWKDRVCDVKCIVNIGLNGAVDLEFAPIPTSKETIWLFEVGVAKKQFLTQLSIQGAAPDGAIIKSDYVYIVECGSASDATSSNIIIRGDAARLRITYGALPEKADGLSVVYNTVGMRAFGVPAAMTPSGRLTLSGPSKIIDPDHINGILSIAAPDDGRLISNWLDECDHLAERVLDMVSLAEGTFIRWSVRQIESADRVLVIDCDGVVGKGPAQDGVFHFLNLQPVLDLALTKYTDELCQRTGLSVALEWFVHHPHYSELQLVSSMTALEHLVAVFIQHNPPPLIVPKECFDRVLVQMKVPWQNEINDAGDDKILAAALTRGREKLNNLNEGSFRDKLQAMLQYYAVPLSGLEWPMINKAVQARNLVVHRGLYRSTPNSSQSDSPHILRHVTVLRELIKRIFLSLLEFEGQYFSLLNGPDWIHFPPPPDSNGPVNQS